MQKLTFLISNIIICLNMFANNNITQTNIPTENLENKIKEWMIEGNVPGLSLVIIKDNQSIIKNFGYSDINKKELVNSKTLFEIASCSKAFTALAVLKLVDENRLNLDSNVSDYLSWFKVYYGDSLVDITLHQLLHHTSGIPWNTISLISQSDKPDALEQTIRIVNGINLQNLPGVEFEYASINYAILALIIEEVTNKPFETYLQRRIFKDLGLTSTSIGKPIEGGQVSKGYKIGFFKPREYDAPVYKGNNASGYVISNTEDLSKWLKYQMDLLPTEYDSLIIQSHERDKTVMPHNLFSYAFGWDVSLKGDGEIIHGGVNPNFTSYISFRKKENIGVAILANSNSPYTAMIARNVMELLTGGKIHNDFNNKTIDKTFSVASIILCITLIFIFLFFGYIIYGILKGKRRYEPLTRKQIGYAFLTLVLIAPFLFIIYTLPKVLAGFNWESAIVWTPISFPVAIILCLSSIVLSYLAYIFSMLFPEQNKYIRDAPKLILLSILSGLSNMAVILLITSSLRNTIELKYLLFYFVVTLTVYLVMRKVVQTKMIYLTRNIIYDLRMNLIDKIFSTSYEKFEKIDRGRLYTTMNDDIGTIGSSANTFVNVSTSIITAGGAFIYLATIAFWATMVTVILVGSISSVYYIVSRKTQPLFEDARETRTVYMRLLNGLIDGFKELSIHRQKKVEYQNDVEKTTDEYRKKICIAHVKFVNAFLIGESLLIMVLATVTFAIPRIFPGIQFYTIMSFLIILLYLIGPVNAILRLIPQLMQLRIAWDRVQSFIQDIPANLSLTKLLKRSLFDEDSIVSVKAKSLSYQYDGVNGKDGFSIGPIDLEINKGEVLFIIGGNGSGKTTLAKLLTGLYSPSKGELFINNRKVDHNEIGEYFSTVFNPFHLFQKLYNVDLSGKSSELILNDFLQILQLEDKVTISENQYSTINLSGGQRKRLALLQCYLEQKPVYLFDEWAADQDPEYRKFFYRELLKTMKDQGKIIIAITHDDHYFDVADKILKLDRGKVEFLKNTNEVKKGIFTSN